MDPNVAREDFRRMKLLEMKQRVSNLVGGKRVVVIYRPGGRIDREYRYDSSSNDLAELQGVELSLGLFAEDGGVGTGIIGKGYIGFAPWELSDYEKIRTATKAEKFKLGTPIRVADVVENSQTGITMVYMESS